MTEEKSRKSMEDLDVRLRKARAGEGGGGGRHPVLGIPASGMGMAFRIGVELVAALLVGVGIGLLLDRWLDTAPWFFVTFFFLGAGAGILNVYRAASGIGLAAGYREPEGSSDRDRRNTDGEPR